MTSAQTAVGLLASSPIALARALVRQPAILVLDEPASALDAQTEASIHRTLQRLAKGRTVIAVTHRLTTSVSDRILVLKAGRLVEEGRHVHLVALGGTSAELWGAQSQPDVVGHRSQADATIDSSTCRSACHAEKDGPEMRAALKIESVKA